MSLLFFFNDTATTEIYTLSLHDALPIWTSGIMAANTVTVASLPLAPLFAECDVVLPRAQDTSPSPRADKAVRDRKSTRLNSSHANISYAVFCLKKKKAKNAAILNPKTHI